MGGGGVVGHGHLDVDVPEDRSECLVIDGDVSD
jgi:hypothetical protein